MEIKISEINSVRFNPFAATEEELIANAIEQAGLLTKTTQINGKAATTLCQSYFDKRENFKKSTRIGNVLVDNLIISNQQLSEALAHQRQEPEQKLGDALMTLNMCTTEQISKGLDIQSSHRSVISPIDSANDVINAIRNRIKRAIKD